MAIEPSRVLVADDESFFRQTIVSYLEDEEIECEEAADGEEALAAFERGGAQVALLNLRMPRLSGLDVLRRFRERDPDMPVIVISGSSEMQDVVEVLRLGATDFVSKPVRDPNLLVEKIRRAFDHRRQLHEARERLSQLEQLVESGASELEAISVRLDEKNIALREVLTTVEEEKKAVSRGVGDAIDKVILPLLNNLRSYVDAAGVPVLEQVAREIQDLRPSSAGARARLDATLTPTEIRICAMIRRGLSSKEIAAVEGLSAATIQTHRRNIRNKLKLVGSGANLMSFLDEPKDS